MKISLDGQPFEGSKTNTLENVKGGLNRFVGEALAALDGKEGAFECSDISGQPGITVTITVAKSTTDDETEATTSKKPKK